MVLYDCHGARIILSDVGVQVLVVMGHEGCGAVKSACLPNEIIEKETVHLRALLLGIKAHLDATRVHEIKSPRARDRESVVLNTTEQMRRLQRVCPCIAISALHDGFIDAQLVWLFQNVAVKAKLDSGELLLVGAFYEITSGIVDFHQLTEDGIAEMP